MSKGSDLFYEPFKGDAGLPTKERQRGGGELMNTMTHSHMFVYKMLLSCFDYHKWQFSSSELHLNNVLTLSYYILKYLGSWRGERPLKGTP